MTEELKFVYCCSPIFFRL